MHRFLKDGVHSQGNAQANVRIALSNLLPVQEKAQAKGEDKLSGLTKDAEKEVKKSHGTLGGMLAHHLMQAMQLGGSAGGRCRSAASNLELNSHSVLQACNYSTCMGLGLVLGRADCCLLRFLATLQHAAAETQLVSVTSTAAGAPCLAPGTGPPVF